MKNCVLNKRGFEENNSWPSIRSFQTNISCKAFLGLKNNEDNKNWKKMLKTAESLRWNVKQFEKGKIKIELLKKGFPCWWLVLTICRVRKEQMQQHLREILQPAVTSAKPIEERFIFFVVSYSPPVVRRRFLLLLQIFLPSPQLSPQMT